LRYLSLKNAFVQRDTFITFSKNIDSDMTVVVCDKLSKVEK